MTLIDDYLKYKAAARRLAQKDEQKFYCTESIFTGCMPGRNAIFKDENKLVKISQDALNGYTRYEMENAIH